MEVISAPSILEGTISTVASGLRIEEVHTNKILTAEISQREDAVTHIMKDIVIKAMAVIDPDKTDKRNLYETGHTIDDLGELQNNDYWAGRARRHSEANRPRGRSL